jgi:hypothetical protein
MRNATCNNDTPLSLFAKRLLFEKWGIEKSLAQERFSMNLRLFIRVLGPLVCSTPYERTSHQVVCFFNSSELFALIVEYTD